MSATWTRRISKTVKADITIEKEDNTFKIMRLALHVSEYQVQVEVVLSEPEIIELEKLLSEARSGIINDGT